MTARSSANNSDGRPRKWVMYRGSRRSTSAHPPTTPRSAAQPSPRDGGTACRTGWMSGRPSPNASALPSSMRMLQRSKCGERASMKVCRAYSLHLAEVEETPHAERWAFEGVVAHLETSHRDVAARYRTRRRACWMRGSVGSHEETWKEHVQLVADVSACSVSSSTRRDCKTSDKGSGSNVWPGRLDSSSWKKRSEQKSSSGS